MVLYISVIDTETQLGVFGIVDLAPVMLITGTFLLFSYCIVIVN